jgi:hypothetical protein
MAPPIRFPMQPSGEGVQEERELGLFGGNVAERSQKDPIL